MGRNISRRTFLHSAGTMTLATAAAGLLSGCDLSTTRTVAIYYVDAAGNKVGESEVTVSKTDKTVSLDLIIARKPSSYTVTDTTDPTITSSGELYSVTVTVEKIPVTKEVTVSIVDQGGTAVTSFAVTVAADAQAIHPSAADVVKNLPTRCTLVETEEQAIGEDNTVTFTAANLTITVSFQNSEKTEVGGCEVTVPYAAKTIASSDEAVKAKLAELDGARISQAEAPIQNKATATFFVDDALISITVNGAYRYNGNNTSKKLCDGVSAYAPYQTETVGINAVASYLNGKTFYPGTKAKECYLYEKDGNGKELTAKVENGAATFDLTLATIGFSCNGSNINGISEWGGSANYYLLYSAEELTLGSVLTWSNSLKASLQGVIDKYYGAEKYTYSYTVNDTGAVSSNDLINGKYSVYCYTTKVNKS